MEGGGQEGGDSNPNPQTLISDPKPKAHSRNPSNHVEEGLDTNLPTQVSISGLKKKPISIDVGEKRVVQETISPSRPRIKKRKKTTPSKSKASKEETLGVVHEPIDKELNLKAISKPLGDLEDLNTPTIATKLKGRPTIDKTTKKKAAQVLKDGEEDGSSHELVEKVQKTVFTFGSGLGATVPDQSLAKGDMGADSVKRGTLKVPKEKGKTTLGAALQEKTKKDAKLGKLVKTGRSEGHEDPPPVAAIQEVVPAGKAPLNSKERRGGGAQGNGKRTSGEQVLEKGESSKDLANNAMNLVKDLNQDPTRNQGGTRLQDPAQFPALVQTQTQAQARTQGLARPMAQNPTRTQRTAHEEAQTPVWPNLQFPKPNQGLTDSSGPSKAQFTSKEDQNSGLPPKAGPSKSFSSLFRDNRSTCLGMKMNCMSEPCVDDDDDAVMDTCDYVPFVETWGYCLIGCFTGNFPGRAALDVIVKSWGVRCKLIPYGKGWTIFKFLSEVDRDTVFSGGPYMQYGKTLMLKLVEKGTVFTDDLFMKVPVWCRFPDVPLSIWGESGLSKLASKVGFPHCTDQITKERTKLSYARILIDVDVSKKPRMQFGVRMPEGLGSYVQRVEYESYPMYCCDCMGFGHSWFDCPQRAEERQGNLREERRKPTSQKGAPPPKPPGFSASHASPSMPSTMPVDTPMTSVMSPSMPYVPTPVLSPTMPFVPYVPLSMRSMHAPPSVKPTCDTMPDLGAYGVHENPTFATNSFAALSESGVSGLDGGGLGTSSNANPPAGGISDVGLWDDTSEEEAWPMEGDDSLASEDGAWQTVGETKKNKTKKKKKILVKKNQDRRGGALSSSVVI